MTAARIDCTKFNLHLYTIHVSKGLRWPKLTPPIKCNKFGTAILVFVFKPQINYTLEDYTLRPQGNIQDNITKPIFRSGIFLPSNCPFVFLWKCYLSDTFIVWNMRWNFSLNFINFFYVYIFLIFIMSMFWSQRTLKQYCLLSNI